MYDSNSLLNSKIESLNDAIPSFSPGGNDSSPIDDVRLQAARGAGVIGDGRWATSRGPPRDYGPGCPEGR